ncbi:MAG: response regulator [Hyphomicrobiaceae bacterium]
MTIVVNGDGPVLAVDDDVIFRDVVELLYTASGVKNELNLFENGQECLDHCIRLATAGIAPSVVLMDINMPGMNGFETVKKLRQLQGFAIVPIIIMLSSSNEPLDIQRAKDAGANDYIVKPQSVDELSFAHGEAA